MLFGIYADQFVQELKAALQTSPSQPDNFLLCLLLL